jgi:hypothetical protein
MTRTVNNHSYVLVSPRLLLHPHAYYASAMVVFHPSSSPSGFCRPNLNMALSGSSDANVFTAASNDRATSLVPLRRISSSYEVIAVSSEIVPDLADWRCSTSSAASCNALLRPCPRSALYQPNRICKGFMEHTWQHGMCGVSRKRNCSLIVVPGHIRSPLLAIIHRYVTLFRHYLTCCEERFTQSGRSFFKERGTQLRVF